jgi:TonB family protein
MSRSPDSAAQQPTAGAISAGVSIVPRTPSSRAWRAALVASVVLHGVLLGWAVLHFSAASFGARGVQLEGIEIEVISAAALDSLLRAAQPVGGGTTAPTENDGQAAVARPEQPPPIAPQAAVPDMPQSLSVIAAPEAEARVPDAAPDPKPVVEAKPHEASTPVVAAPSADAGGSTSEAAVPSAQASGAAGAAAGEVQRYALDVRRVLSRSRPKTGWPAGTLRVAFTVSDAGDVAKAEIVEASGNARLDQRALAWIGATRFPVPPVGLTSSERTYSIPLTVTGKGP